MKRMKATIRGGRGKRGVHGEDESRNLGRKRERGVHEEDESHNPGRLREKWCSSSG
ncbi:hypothetical protein [Niallia circulans]|uniref:hypothetical protein n=1 Tax=Niallia circulans TaxID=1397 RepID=UPI0019D27A1F|nr:hypothetical protein [Niallia circulans]